eukprot:m.87217 g.87217  ORF g.87217 m.87217 type:complete len:85 (-) comp14497_c0_seq1:3283-3537(-)
MSAAFRPTAVQQFARLSHHETNEDRFWQKFESPRMIKEIGSVLAINFCPSRPHNFAVTAGSHIHIYDGATQTSKQKFGRFTAAR